MTPAAGLDRALLGEIYASTAIEETLFELCDRIGPRFAGTRGEGDAARAVLRRFRSAGLEKERLEPFPFTAWRRGAPASVRVVSPVERILSAVALPYSPDTGPSGIEASVLALGDGTPEEFGEAGRGIRGKIVLTREGVPPGYRRAVHRAEKYGRAVEAGAAGFLFANSEPGGLAPTGVVRFGRAAEIPAAGISREDAEFLRRLAGRGRVRAELRAFGTVGAGRSHNVLAELRGRSEGGEAVVVGGHLDSHDIAPGAHDNAAGVCVVLETARALAAAGFRPEWTVRFAAFGAEEVGLLGSRAHVARMGARAAGVRWMVNVDSPPMDGAFALEIHRAGEARPFFDRLSAELGREIPVRKGLHAHSDHYPFFLAGVPVANLAAPARAPGSRPGARGWGHTAADTPDKVDAGSLRSAADFLARTLVRLAGPGGFRLPARSPEEVARVRRDEGFDENLKFEE